jgi:hypothetical protein
MQLDELPTPPSDSSPDYLRHLVLEYNWDDGLTFPQRISDHPACDLAVALEIFWLADAVTVLLGEEKINAYNADWRNFCTVLTERILSGHYARGLGSFEMPLTRTQIYNYRKRGVPDLLLTSVQSVQA